jgi:NADH-quinone oxidoreductase subunit L
MRKMGGLRKVMPITFITMLISSLAISGIPFFSGFFSKDEILMVAFEHNKIYWIIASAASIMTAFYMFRLMFLTFFKDFRGTDEQKKHLHESPILITFPLIILAILATIGGLISLPGSSWLNEYLAPIFHKVNEEHHLTGQDYALMTVAVLGALAGIIYAYIIYIKRQTIPVEDTEIQGFDKVLYNKYFVDEFYHTTIVKPINAVSNFCRNHVETTISAGVFGLGKITNNLGTQGRKLHNGSIGLYLFGFVIAFCVILACLFL